MKSIITCGIACFLFVGLQAQNADMATYLFAERDTQNLYLDIYTPQNSPKACVVFAFGGGFMSGSRNDESLLPYFELLCERGYQVVAFDYRLGLKDKKINSLSIKPVENAIMIAVEDLYTATRYLIDNSQQLQIDTSKIVLMGSSAGAITALQADYMLSRYMPIAQVLPIDFRFAGVVSFAGGIMSREGKVNYLREPAPTFFLHGTKDKLVPYKKIQIFNIGIFGDNSLIKRFKKSGYPFVAHRYEGYGHEIAGIMIYEIEAVDNFIETLVLAKQFKQNDSSITDHSIQKQSWGRAKPSQLHEL